MEKTSAKIKRPLWVAGLNIALALTIGSTQAFANVPIEITDKAGLLAIGRLEGSPISGEYVVMDNFIVDAAIDNTYVTGTFTGTFDGGGFTISGLTKPLFDVIAGDESSPAATISDLTLEAAGVGVSGNGILAIVTYVGTDIENVHVVGNINGESNVGGLLGINFGGTITNSSATGNVVGTNGVGGLIGFSSGTITNSYATGDVGGTDDVGGLIGYSEGTITDSYANVTVTGTGDTGRIGGLAGYTSGTITNSYATGDVTGYSYVGGLVGQVPGAITNSYASGNVTGGYEVGGLVGYQYGDIANSYASGNVTGYSYVGGLVGQNWAAALDAGITRSYAGGDVIGFQVVGGLVGDNYVDIDAFSYGAGEVTGTGGGYIQPSSGLPPLSATELLAILNTGYDDPVFAIDSNINEGRPHLISHLPPNEDNGDEDNGNEQVSPWFNFSFLPTQALDALSKSFGFEEAKRDLNKLDLALLDPIKDDMSAPIIGSKLFANQSLSTSLSVGSLLQLEINFEANKSLQMWVKSSDDQYVLLGDVTFDKDGNALLPGIEFKKSGQYELIFVNSDKEDLTQPELVNKVSGLTVYVN